MPLLRFRAASWPAGLALGLVVALVTQLVAGALDLPGHLAAWTEPAAWLRADALPFSLLALAVTAAWLAFRRQARLAKELATQEVREARAAFFAHHDPLTRLPNRTLLRDRLERSVAQAERGGGWLALLVLDLNRFGAVNDAFGHAAGDLVLIEAARRLGACARAADTVARFGGDEFAVVLSQLGRAAEAAPVAERIVHALTEPYHVDGHEVRIGVSAGITVYPDDGAEVEQLLTNADLALREAKEERVGCRYFMPDIEGRGEARRALEAQLRSALAGDEFLLFYQPVVGIADRRVHLVEALLRWRHPERGLLAPRAFAAVAEESGLMAPLGDWTLRAACAQVKAWREAGLALPVGVNLSRPQLLRDGFVAAVAEVLRATGIEPGLLEFELNERVFVRRGGDTALAKLRELLEMGVGLSFDDFGTGASSLALLKLFRGHRLKIDRTIVRDMLSDPGDAAIVRAIINLGHTLGLRVVAEGVETAEQVDFLRVQGCDEAQGHYFARPQPAAGLAGLLRRKPARPAAERAGRPHWVIEARAEADDCP